MDAATNKWSQLPGAPIPTNIVTDSVGNVDLVVLTPPSEIQFAELSLKPLKLVINNNDGADDTIILLARICSRGIVLTQFLPVICTFNVRDE